MTIVRKIIPAALILAMALTGVALSAQEKPFNQTLDLKAGGRLSMKTYKGSIEITPWDRPQIEIVARIVPGDDVSDRYAERSVEATRIEVRGSGSSVYIESEYEAVPCRRGRSFLGIFNTGCSKVLPFVHYKIRAPRKLDFRLDDYKSEIVLTELEGRIEIETYKGKLDAGRLTGDIRLDTYKGTARLEEISGSIDIETYKGEVRIDAAQLNERSRIETYKGRVSITLPEAQQLDIRASLGRRADFDSDFPLTLRTWNRNEVRGEINGGGPLLSIETYKGEIRLRKR